MTSDLSLLEVGCGSGVFLRCCQRWFPNATIVGGDFDRRHAVHTRRVADRSSTLQFDAHVFPIRDESIDILTSFQVIEHLRSPSAFLKECNRVLTDTGLLCLSTPNKNCLSSRILKDKWQGRHPDHISLFSPDRLRALLNEIGFKVVNDGTTGVSGFKFIRKTPLILLTWIPQLIFGYFPWYHGESYMVIGEKI